MLNRRQLRQLEINKDSTTGEITLLYKKNLEHHTIYSYIHNLQLLGVSLQIDSEVNTFEGEDEEEAAADKAPTVHSEPTVEAAVAKRPKEIPYEENEISEENPWLSTFTFPSSTAATRPSITAKLENSSLVQNNKWTKVESAKSKKSKAADSAEGNSADVATNSLKGRKNETAKDKEVPKSNTTADTDKTKIAPGKEKAIKNAPSTEKSISAPDAEKAKTVRAPLLMQKSQVRSYLVGLYNTVQYVEG